MVEREERSALKNMELLYPVAINAVFSLVSFFIALQLIPSTKELFIKAGLKRTYKNRGSEFEIPESLGIICGTVYLICMFLFIPIPFVTKWMEHDGNDILFPHNEFVEFVTALLSICCMILLGFAEDILHLRWRDKLILPLIASLPLLMVYHVNVGSTTIIIPEFLRCFLGPNLNLGIFYYIYMCILAVYCTNTINILVGINGLETGQSIVIGISILIFNVVELNNFYWKNHLFSMYFLIPYVATSCALHYHNWYPANVFVGETFCYFSGMTFAVVAILGHFSKTMMLFFIPQTLNFLYSIPQIFRFIPCPRYRLPKYNEETDRLEISTVTFKQSNLGFVGSTCVQILSTFKLLVVKKHICEDGEYMEVNNLTLMNFIIKLYGPMHEKDLVYLLLLIQVAANCLGLVIRYNGAIFLYEY